MLRFDIIIDYDFMAEGAGINMIWFQGSTNKYKNIYLYFCLLQILSFVRKILNPEPSFMLKLIWRWIFRAHPF